MNEINGSSSGNGKRTLRQRILRVSLALALALPLVVIGLLSGACGTRY